MVPKHTNTYTFNRSLPKAHPLSRILNSWVVFLGAMTIGMGCLYLGVAKRQSPPPTLAKAAPLIAATPEPTPLPAQKPPRAEPVTGPATSTGEIMVAGHQYTVSMPDGRHLLVNYKGWVDHACNLPRQHGINNAAYTEAATGNTWIWTLPATGPNVPRWIDP